MLSMKTKVSIFTEHLIQKSNSFLWIMLLKEWLIL